MTEKLKWLHAVEEVTSVMHSPEYVRIARQCFTATMVDHGALQLSGL